MTAAEARKRYRSKLKTAPNTLRERFGARMRGVVNTRRILELAEEGLTLAQVCERLGRCEQSIRSSLRKQLGTGAWPPQRKLSNDN